MLPNRLLFICCLVVCSCTYLLALEEDERTKAYQEEAIAAFVASKHYYTSPESLTLFHSRLAGLRAIMGQDPATDLAEAQKSLQQIEDADERYWCSWDITESLAYANDLNKLFPYIQQFEAEHRMDLLGLAAYAMVSLRRPIPEELRTAYQHSKGDFSALLGKPNPNWTPDAGLEDEEPEIVDAETISLAQHSWAIALAAQQDAAEAVELVKSLKDGGLSELLADMACERFWFDHEDVIAQGWLGRALDLAEAHNDTDASTKSSLLAAAYYSKDEQFQKRAANLGVINPMWDTSETIWLLADNIRVARKDKNASKALAYFQIGLSAIQYQLTQDEEAITWLEWDVVELFRGFGDIPLPDNVKPLADRHPLLWPAIRYGQARHAVLPNEP